MTHQLPGQLPLFTVDGLDEQTLRKLADETCSGEDCWCQSPATTTEAQKKPEKQ
jgi:hypothetical protein